MNIIFIALYHTLVSSVLKKENKEAVINKVIYFLHKVHLHMSLFPTYLQFADVSMQDPNEWVFGFPPM